jgi:hypothetical protein
MPWQPGKIAPRDFVRGKSPLVERHVIDRSVETGSRLSAVGASARL